MTKDEKTISEKNEIREDVILSAIMCFFPFQDANHVKRYFLAHLSLAVAYI